MLKKLLNHFRHKPEQDIIFEIESQIFSESGFDYVIINPSLWNKLKSATHEWHETIEHGFYRGVQFEFSDAIIGDQVLLGVNL